MGEGMADLRDRISELGKALESARSDLEAHRLANSTATCVFCEWRMAAPAGDRKTMLAQHVASCPAHPMRALEKLLEGARSEVGVLRSGLRLAELERDEARAELARLQPSGQVAEDRKTLQMAWWSDCDEDCDGDAHTKDCEVAGYEAALSRLAAKAQSYEQEHALRMTRQADADAATAAKEVAMRECDAAAKELADEKSLHEATHDELHKCEAELARLQPSGQVAEDRDLVVSHVSHECADGEPTALCRGCQMSDAAERLAAKAQSYDAAVTDSAAKHKAFSTYVEMYGVQHGVVPGTETYCPEDDTCECEHVHALNAAFGSARPGAALLERTKRLEAYVSEQAAVACEEETAITRACGDCATCNARKLVGPRTGGPT